MSASLTATAKATNATVPKMSTKPSKSKIIKLPLPSALLARFPHEKPVRKPSPSEASSSSTSTPATQAVEPPPSINTSEANSTPLPNGTASDSTTLAPPANGAKRKGIPGPKPGAKRGPSLLDGVTKPRGKPGPKKKPRLGDLANDPLAKGSFGGVTPITSSKLNPKANQGAINANLRALDRTGKPCRKWERKGFQLKSFTGVTWTVPTWRAPNKSAVEFSGDVKSDSSTPSDVKMSDAVASDKSNSGPDAVMLPPPLPASSP
ncbi:hypothetical protein H2201_001368 [Coniosporium apollinis]|uniref:INO80 complex, subunit Ies4 n=1 Tax=Coniosporium apollinis TaxID=61459 RepID=A0ABQ9P428_9PEZI|nr:hypothetical protein H2201_001368 [Coniosporium apollinis]